MEITYKQAPDKEKNPMNTNALRFESFLPFLKRETKLNFSSKNTKNH